MKKQYLTYSFLLLSCLYLVACGSEKPAEPEAKIESTAETIIEPTVAEVEAQPEETPPVVDPFDRKSVDLRTLDPIDYDAMDLEGMQLYDNGLVPLSFYYPDTWEVEEDKRKIRVYLRDTESKNMIIVAATATSYPQIPPVDLKDPPKSILRKIGELMGSTESDTESIQVPFELTVGNGIEAAQMEARSADGATDAEGNPVSMYGNMTSIDVLGFPYVIYGRSSKEDQAEMKQLVDEVLATLQYSDTFKQLKEEAEKTAE